MVVTCDGHCASVVHLEPAGSVELRFELLGLEVFDRRINEQVELAFEDLGEAVNRQTDAMVRDPPLREIVRPDLLRSVAGADLAASLGGPLGVTLGLLDLQKSRFEHPQRLGLVLNLRLLVLAGDHQSGG